jgi:predicted transcriptional regulator
MPQPEREKNIAEMLQWLQDVQNEATLSQLISYVKMEVTRMGGTERTIRSYIEDCHKYGLIEFKGNPPRWRITNAGRKWLEKYGV